MNAKQLIQLPAIVMAWAIALVVILKILAAL